MSEYLDDDGYPTEEALNRIKKWPWQDGWVELFEFINSIWWMADWGWRQTYGYNGNNESYIEYNISTGGWSGNESIIDALQENTMAWSFCWQQSRRGGHYIFTAKDTTKV